MFLLDTNVCVVYMRGKNALVRARVSACPITDLFLCAPVEAELRFGALNGKTPASETQKVEAFLTPYPKLAFDDAASREYARLRLDLSRRGLLISEMDMLIAAITLAHGLTLVTHNTAEFSRVPGLHVVDWELP